MLENSFSHQYFVNVIVQLRVTDSKLVDTNLRVSSLLEAKTHSFLNLSVRLWDSISDWVRIQPLTSYM